VTAALTFLDALVEALERAGSYNKDVQTAPAAVLWPDKDRQWEPLLPRLRERLPLLTLGPYAPQERTGPAYWQRCMIARTLPEDVLAPDLVPILYLPGISRQEIRAVEDCPKALQPLAELQYRGVLWTQKNARDWTLAAFLQTKDGGLEIEVGADQATKEALRRALLKLADEPVAHLRKEAPLRAPFFDALLNPDEVRRLLLWLNDPANYPGRVTGEEWAAFCQLCQRKYSFHPERDGALHAAQQLGKKYGPWHLVWKRYEEAPHSYPHLPDLLRSARPAQLALFDRRSGAWPQDNEEAEQDLRQQLLQLGRVSLQEARAPILNLEEQHARRRAWVWAQLDQAPLATALEHLAELARETERALGGGTLQEIVTAYTGRGWKADAAVLNALAGVDRVDDVAAVKVAIGTLYRPWLDDTTRTFQTLALSSESQALRPDASILDVPQGTCILFSDALRFDAARRLAAALERDGYECQLDTQLAALPTITATSKPALSPIAELVTGRSSSGLTPAVAATGAQLTAEGFRKLLAAAGYQVLRSDDDLGDPSGKAWTELGAIDSYGHQHGWKVAHHLLAELRALEKRIQALLAHGWTQVMVITDHGWLLLPGTLPKAHLPEHLTVLRKGRCARLKEFAESDQQTVPWFWDPNVRVAMATGIHCYEAGKEYEHGGLSLQECVVPVLTVGGADQTAEPVLIEDVTWRGLRCVLRVGGATPELIVDIRTKAGDPATSLVTATRSPDAEGEASLLVENEDCIGQAALIVALSEGGLIRAQSSTVIGE